MSKSLMLWLCYGGLMEARQHALSHNVRRLNWHMYVPNGSTTACTKYMSVWAIYEGYEDILLTSVAM